MTRTIINRESLRNGDLVRWLEKMAPVTGVRPRTPEEMEASLRSCLDDAPEGEIWVFGYGSLIWNPAIHYDERRSGRIHGWHRDYCLWTPIGRGTPENPGLMLGLERGGSCRGAAYRLPEGQEEEELSLVWSREMLTDSYRPRWVRVITDGGPVQAITFVVNREGARYTGTLDDDTVVHHLASASGHLGSCTEYLDNTVAHLAELGIHDARLARLHRLVTDHCARR